MVNFFGDKIMVNRVAVLCLFLFASIAHASTITIDFEEFPDAGPVGTSLSSKGYSFLAEAVFIPGAYGAFTDIALVYCPFCTITFANESGNPFALHSFDYAAIFVGPGTVNVTGHYAAGGVISTNLNADETVDNYQFNEAWTGLDYVVIGTISTSSPAGIDNIVVSAVPIPAAVWLFGSALAGLGWMRRKQTV